MELGGWDIILGVDWMFQYSPIIFDFHRLNITLYNDGNVMELQGQVDMPLMKLVRGEDLREFILYKNRCLATLHTNSNNPSIATLPIEITNLLNQFPEVFQTPKNLPQKGHWTTIYYLNQTLSPLK